jgi:hypothetical protein
LFVVTDGMLERNAADLDVNALVEAGAALHPREAVQHLVQGLLVATDGELQDDAAAMCLDWHGDPPHGSTLDAASSDAR